MLVVFNFGYFTDGIRERIIRAAELRITLELPVFHVSFSTETQDHSVLVQKQSLSQSPLTTTPAGQNDLITTCVKGTRLY
jgi:hypothetical protein